MKEPKTPPPSLAERALAARASVTEEQARTAAAADARADAVRRGGQAWLAAAFAGDPAQPSQVVLDAAAGARHDHLYAQVGGLALRVAVGRSDETPTEAELVVACPGCRNVALVPVPIREETALADLGAALAYEDAPNCATCLTGPRWNP